MKLGLLSDIHEDLTSLLKAIRLLEKQGCSKLICLGDTVGYSSPFFNYSKSRDGGLCLEIIQDSCEWIIKGNHDLYAIREIPQNKPDFNFDWDWYQLPLEERKKRADGKVWLYEPQEAPLELSPSQEEFIRKLPEYQTVDLSGYLYLFSHYLYPDLTGSGSLLPPVDPLFLQHQEFLDHHHCSYAFFGHVHSEGLLVFYENGPKLYKYGNRVELKPRSVIGIPCVANGRNQPGVCLLETTEHWVQSIPLRNYLRRWFT